MAEAAEHSLQVVEENFKKIHEPKISKLKGGYLAIGALIFNSCIKDLDICVQDCNLTEHEAVQLVKDYTTEHTCGTVKFYLNMNDQWSYSKLIEHFKNIIQVRRNIQFSPQ